MKIYKHLPLNTRARMFEKNLMDRHWPSWYKETYREVLNHALDTFLTIEEREDKELVQALTHDIVKCWLQYEALPYEYFLYDLRHCDDEKRSTFMTDVLKDKLSYYYSGEELFNKELKDKYAFYRIMKPFYGREVFQVNSETNEDAFVSFAQKAGFLFCKLATGSRGGGAFAKEVLCEEDAKKLFMRLTKNQEDEWVVEECIKQCQEMAQWNESSVNTVRLPAFMTKSGFKVLCPAFRTGRRGSVIDNAAQGGIVIGIEPNSGVLMTDGVDELGHVYKNHPDSGGKFKGWQIPRWNELLNVAEKAHRTIPHHKYIGWDFALTDEGWVLIEGNWGQMIGQYATKVGVKDEFLQYIKN